MIVFLLLVIVVVRAEPAGEPIVVFNVPDCEQIKDVYVEPVTPVAQGEYILLDCTEKATNRWSCDDCFVELYTSPGTVNEYKIDTVYSTTDDSAHIKRNVFVVDVFPLEENVGADEAFPVESSSPLDDPLDSTDEEEVSSVPPIPLNNESLPIINSSSEVVNETTTPEVEEVDESQDEELEEQIVEQEDYFNESTNNTFLEEYRDEDKETQKIDYDYALLRLEEAERVQKLFLNALGFVMVVLVVISFRKKRDNNNKNNNI